MKPKDEIEKLADNWSDDYEQGSNRYIAKRSYIAGYTKCQEDSKDTKYSEEEVYHILCEHTAELFKGSKLTLTEWFEQFKKK
jgi:hypothetical protein